MGDLTADGPLDGRLGLRDLDLDLGYDSADAALSKFYIPALSRAVQYDRSVGYFRSSALAVAAKGLSHFIASGGTARFLVGAEVEEGEREALLGATEIPSALAERLATELVPADEIAQQRLAVLAWLVREERLTIRVAVATDEHGVPVGPGVHVPYFHEKIGILRDHRGDGVAFQGSINESETAWMSNFESFSVFKSWSGDADHFDVWATKFETRWSGQVPQFTILPLPEALRAALVRLAPEEPPPARDPEEPPARIDRRNLARFLIAAPRLIGAEALAEATSGIAAFPHQRQVVERLASEYPRSWLVADEVGLGKTISAGLALRRLLLTGEVERVLILAPANVCQQWQDELFERFGLWIPRLDGGHILGAHPDDDDLVGAGTNPYEEHRLLLVSSHLARRPRHQELILEAPTLDLLVVDEAHHARRRGADTTEYRPSRLLQLLDSVNQADHARAVWLLTATPMQIHPIELHDLLRHVGLAGPFETFGVFERFHQALATPDDAETDWGFLHRSLVQTPRLPANPADQAMEASMATKLGVINAARIARFGTSGEDPATLVGELGPSGRHELRNWVRQRGPVGQLVTRHSRRTLRRYRDQGILHEPIAVRDVKAIPVEFDPVESLLYRDLDDLLDRLMQAHGTKRGAGFVLTVYRRRLTSSWAAIRQTLQRRLQQIGLVLEPEFVDEADETDEGEDLDETETVDDATVVPMSAADLDQVKKYLARLTSVPDTKFDRLRSDIEEARGGGQSIVVFTQFTDTLDYLRDRLHPAYRSHLATFTGAGGQMWSEEQGWNRVSKQELVDALTSGRVSVLLATDAASEGLNLQAASRLVNFDLPWNPMRVEQRIGRIDRIGQPAPVVTVRNYVVPGTVEESVYSALAARIDVFSGLVGNLQPILGATEAAFRQIFRSPKSERQGAERSAIDALVSRVDELAASGLDLGDEDPMPSVEYSQPPVTLLELRRCLAEELDITLDRPGRPTTMDPSRASRDPQRWAALGTYGHPMLQLRLQGVNGSATGDDEVDRALVIAQRGGRAVAYRADRTPTEPVHRLSDLNDLGYSVAATEAEERACQVLDEALTGQRSYVAAVAAAQRERWQRQIVRRFRTLVTRAIRAEQALRRVDDGEAPDPATVWFSFMTDTASGWSLADLFRQHLGIELTDVLPIGGPGVEQRSMSELRRVRATTGNELLSLIKEWRAVVYPDYETPSAHPPTAVKP